MSTQDFHEISADQLPNDAMLVRPNDRTIHLAPGIPPAWKDFAFEVPVHGEGRIEVRVADGRLVRLRIHESRKAPQERIVKIPKWLLPDARRLDGSETEWVVSVRVNGSWELANV